LVGASGFGTTDVDKFSSPRRQNTLAYRTAKTLAGELAQSPDGHTDWAMLYISTAMNLPSIVGLPQAEILCWGGLFPAVRAHLLSLDWYQSM
jgi:hypothetical protein